MIQRGEDFGFPLKASQSVRAGCDRRREDLDGDLPLQLRVGRGVDRFDSLDRARAAVRSATVAFEAAGTAWLMTIEARSSDHHGGRHVAQVGPLPLPGAQKYAMVVQSAVFGPGTYSLVHHHSGVEAVYVVEGEACYETPTCGFTLRKGETVAIPANTPMRAVVHGSARRYVLAVIVHDAAQPATMRMEEASGSQLVTCK
jgi:quercetin dioxygenase-like cupin family protein